MSIINWVSISGVYIFINAIWISIFMKLLKINVRLSTI